MFILRKVVGSSAYVRNQPAFGRVDGYGIDAAANSASFHQKILLVPFSPGVLPLSEPSLQVFHAVIGNGGAQGAGSGKRAGRLCFKARSSVSRAGKVEKASKQSNRTPCQQKSGCCCSRFFCCLFPRAMNTGLGRWVSPRLNPSYGLSPETSKLSSPLSIRRMLSTRTSVTGKINAGAQGAWRTVNVPGSLLGRMVALGPRSGGIFELG